MNTLLKSFVIEPLGDCGLIVRGPQRIDAALNSVVLNLAHDLRNTPIAGVVDIVPAYASLALIVDARWLAQQGEARLSALTTTLQARIDRLAESSASQSRHVEIPVCYGDSLGPDLAAVAAQLGMSAEDVARRHLAGDYRVAFVGFQPGFPYLLGLDEQLVLPRRDVPRVRVPAGSVAIAGAQSGIYPRESPGGWHLIGRTSALLFDAQSTTPTLLLPGDRVSFFRVGANELHAAQVKVSQR